MTTSDPKACMNCGLCNPVDPILTAIHKESASTRYKMILAKQKKANRLFSMAVDTGLQEAACPAGIAIGDIFQTMREHNVREGITTKQNEEMVANFKKTGTPYADMQTEDYHDKQVW